MNVMSVKTTEEGKKKEKKKRVWEKADSLWLSRKRGERVSRSGSREDRGGAEVCSAPVRKAVKEGKRGRTAHYGGGKKVGDSFYAGLRKRRIKEFS